jgi:hypothetical protein
MDQMKRRAQNTYGLSNTDPIIKPQVDYYRAEQNRAGATANQQAAESLSPYATGALRNQQRMTGENVGRNVGSFQAELMSRELANRRSLDQFFNTLGLQAEDKQRYWDAVSSGLI